MLASERPANGAASRGATSPYVEGWKKRTPGKTLPNNRYYGAEFFNADKDLAAVQSLKGDW